MLNFIQSYQEFSRQEKTLPSGYLILLDNQVLHFANKKDWESIKETYPPYQRNFIATDLEKWHAYKKTNS